MIRSRLLRRARLLGALLLGAAVPAAAQTVTVRGTVTDAEKQTPLEGALVQVTGTSLRTQTSATGQFVLANVPVGTVNIQAQRIGFAPSVRAITITAGSDAVVDFALTPRAQVLDEVVAVGYGTQTRAELSSAVSSLTATDVAGTPVASIEGALQGKAAGVQVTQNAGNPGNAMTIRVRGSASLSASNQPLYVVDGVPILSEDISQLGLGGQGISPLTTLSDQEIESVDVLKDAAAAAIYGSRGSNGVVLITTKRGKLGRPTVTFSGYVGTQAASKRLDLMNAQEYLSYMNEAAANDGYGDNYFGEPGVADAVNIDWQSAVLRHAPVSNAELAVAGATDKLRYRVSGNWFDQTGIVIGSGYRRLGGRANLDFNEGGVLSLSTSLAITGERNNRVFGDGSGVGIVTNAVGARPYDPIYNPDGSFAGVNEGTLYPNPVQLSNDPTIARTTRILGNVEGRLRLAPWLRTTSRFGVDYLDLRENQFQSGQVSGTYAADAGGVAKSAFTSNGRYTIENFATLAPNLGSRHALDVTVGSGLEFNRGSLNFIRGEGFSSEALTQVRNATTITEFDGSRSESNLASFFARANYRLAEKYILGASVRTDGSSRFGPNNRWGVFPSVSAGWVVSQEKFLRGSSFLSYLKLRGSWGLTGNQAISDYPYQGLVGSANYGTDPGVGAAVNLANPNLKWESTKQADVGIDISFLRDRISLAADYYVKKTRDLLVNRPISGTSGYTSIFDNVGSMQNKGFELSLTTVNIDSRRAGGLRWSTSLNVSANRNKVTALYHDEPFTGGTNSINRVEVGQPIGAFYTLHFEGVDPQTGDAIFTDVDGDGAITSADRMIVGSPHPDYIGGLSTNISFKGFDISGLLQFSQGAKMFNMMRRYAGNGGYYEDNKFRDELARWQKPGDITNVPRASYDGTSGADLISDRWMEDGSYWRLQNVTVGYTLSPRAARSLGFQTARFYVSGNNLFTSTKFTGFSPDANTGGSLANIGLGTEFYTYPLARTFTFGVQTSW